MTSESDRIAVWLKKANQNYDAGFLDRAEQEYDEVIRMDPNNLDAHYKRGLICYFEDNFDEAKKWFTKMNTIDPFYIHSKKDTLLKIKILIFLQKYEEAQQVFEKEFKPKQIPYDSEVTQAAGFTINCKYCSSMNYKPKFFPPNETENNTVNVEFCSVCNKAALYAKSDYGLFRA